MKIHKLQTNWNQSYGHRGLSLPSFSLAFHMETNLCQGGVLLIFLISPPSGCLWKLQGLFLPSLPHTLLKMPTGPSLLGTGTFTCFRVYYLCPILVEDSLFSKCSVHSWWPFLKNTKHHQISPRFCDSDGSCTEFRVCSYLHISFLCWDDVRCVYVGF